VLTMLLGCRNRVVTRPVAAAQYGIIAHRVCSVEDISFVGSTHAAGHGMAEGPTHERPCQLGERPLHPPLQLGAQLACSIGPPITEGASMPHPHFFASPLHLTWASMGAVLHCAASAVS
jgi:hypothetical protein